MRVKMGNGLPKMGNSLPISVVDSAEMSYEVAVATAVRKQLGGSHQAIKTLMRWTGVSARTAKNWLSGSAGPSGAHLVDLMRSSDFVFEAMLQLARREVPAASSDVETAAAVSLLKQAVSLLEGSDSLAI